MKRWTLIIEGKNVIQTSIDYWRLIFAGAPERISRLGFGDDYAWSIICWRFCSWVGKSIDGKMINVFDAAIGWPLPRSWHRNRTAAIVVPAKKRSSTGFGRRTKRMDVPVEKQTLYPTWVTLFLPTRLFYHRRVYFVAVARAMLAFFGRIIFFYGHGKTYLRAFVTTILRAR